MNVQGSACTDERYGGTHVNDEQRLHELEDAVNTAKTIVDGAVQDAWDTRRTYYSVVGRGGQFERFWQMQYEAARGSVQWTKINLDDAKADFDEFYKTMGDE